MRLLYVTNGINGAGGLERVLSIKASYLADQMNYEVHMLTLNNGHLNLFYEFSSNLILHDIKVGGNPIKYIYNYFTGIKKNIQQINPDVIIVCDDGLKAFFLPTILVRTCPMIYERHVSKEIEMVENASLIKTIFTKTKWKLMNFLGSTYDKFIVLTNGNINEWQLNNLQIIPNPLSFYPEENADLTNKKVIAVGKQCYQKGYDLLLKSWKQVLKQHPDWQLEIYGKKDGLQGLDQLARELRIEKSVTFFEPNKNIKEKYLQSSIYVMSSRFEGFGMVLIEAMACGVPCISYDCPYGPSDIISNNEDGFLVENGDYDTFAKKLSLLIGDNGLRTTFGKNAKQNVKRFQTDIILKQWDELFKEVTS